MNLQQFKTKRLGKKYQENSTLKHQCISLIKIYMEECFGLPRKKSGNANEVWLQVYKYMPSDWERVRNDISDITQVPDVGAVLITDNLNDKNPYGHIGIVTDSGDGRTFTMLQQNGGSGNGDGIGENAILEKKYGYGDVLGWYNPPMMSDNTMNEQDFGEIDEDIQLLIDNKIWNGKEGEGMTNRIGKVIGKLYRAVK